MYNPPVRILPYPPGKDFAVTFVDDTDFSTRANTEPVYDLLDKLNIRGTKTVWVSRQKRTSSFRREHEKPVGVAVDSGATLEDSDYLEYVLDLRRRGFEIALHGVSAGNSYRQEIIDGLEKYKDLLGEYPKINIFHERNIENLYAGYHKLDFWPLKVVEKLTDNSDYQGHIDGSPYFWGDIAREKIKYMRLPFHTIAEVNTLKVNPSMPFHDPKRPYVNYWFASSDGADCGRFNRLLSPENIRTLEKENGACIIYTHFAKGFFKNGALNPQFTDRLHHVAGFRNAWFPTASQLLDRLSAVRSLNIFQSGSEIFIRNDGQGDIEELLLKTSPIKDGADGRNDTQGMLGTGSFVVRAIRAGETVRLNIRILDSIAMLNDNKSNSIGGCEKIRIELLNYYGCLKQAICK